QQQDRRSRRPEPPALASPVHSPEEGIPLEGSIDGNVGMTPPEGLAQAAREDGAWQTVFLTAVELPGAGRVVRAVVAEETVAVLLGALIDERVLDHDTDQQELPVADFRLEPQVLVPPQTARGHGRHNRFARAFILLLT